MKKPVFVLSLLLCAGLAVAASTDLQKSFDSLLDAERAFSAMSAEKGVINAFDHFLEPEAVVLRPTPEFGKKWREAMRNAPAVVTWEPRTAVLSQSGDLAWVTGPWTVVKKDNSPAHHGQFLTVWRKQADGTWRVVLDTGIATRQLDASTAAPLVLRTPAQPGGDAKAARDAVMAADRKLSEAAMKSEPADYLSFLAEDVRFVRMFELPVLGKEAARAAVAQSWTPLRWRQEGGDTSSAGDLVYTYGTLENAAGQGRTESGYLRIWERKADGSWTVAVDLMTWLPTQHGVPPPEPPKQN
jgi:ketosteroid isomerase-like protein